MMNSSSQADRPVRRPKLGQKKIAMDCQDAAQHSTGNGFPYQFSQLLASLAFIISLSWLFASPPASAADRPALSSNQKPLSQYTLTRWNTRDGLPHNSINGIAQDQQGYIWLATWEGPVRFNGREFQVFDDLNTIQMPESGTLGVVASAIDDRVWFSGPRGGLTRFANEQWQALEQTPGFVFELAKDAQGDIWAAASGAGVVRYRGEQILHIYGRDEGLPHAFAVRVFSTEAHAGRAAQVWAGTSAGLAYYEPQTDRFVAAESVPKEQILALLQHSSGCIFVGTESGIYYQKEAGQDFVPWRNGYQGQITALEEGPFGGVLFGTLTNGLGRITEHGVSWLTTDSGLPNPHVLTIFRDREDNIWVSTHGGLVQLRDALFTSYSRTHGLQGNFTRAVIGDGEHVWAGTSEGLSQLEGNRFVSGLRDDSDYPLSVLSLAPAKKGGLYVGTYDQGLLKVSEGEVVARLDDPDLIERLEVRTVHPLWGSDRLLLGNPAALFLVEDNTEANGQSRFEVVARLGDNNGVYRSTVTAVAQVENERVYLASTRGISQLHMQGEPSEWHTEHVNLEDFTPSRNVFGAYYDGEYAWFAADRGVLVVHDESQRWTWISRQHGLPFNKYFSVAFDAEGHMWLGSNRGVTRVSRRSLDAVLAAPEHERLDTLHFRETEGLLSSQINTGGPASWRDANGDLWFATALGVSRINPLEVSRPQATPPQPVVETMLINGKAQAGGARLQPNDSRIEFHYAGLGYRMTEHIEYQVRLQGFDDAWVDQGTQITTQYTSLPPGKYSFQVRARYPSGEWSQAGSFAFSKAAHFTQTRAFWLLMVLLLAVVVVLYVRLRTYRIRRTQRHLQALVDEKTAKLAKLAHEDPLTGLANRRAFDDRLQNEVERAKADNHRLSIAIIDLDNFKQINDRFLHAAGDQVLQAVADILRANLRDEDFVARWGGEEFAIVFPAADEAEAKQICTRLSDALKATRFEALDDDWMVTMSVGLVELSARYDAASALVLADGLLYQAKSQGRDKIVTAQAD